MRKQSLNLIFKYFLTLAILLTVGITSQAQNSAVGSIRNITQTAPNELQFELWVENTSTTTSTVLKLHSFAWGINFNTAILNGGTVGCTLTSANTALSAAHQAQTVNTATAGHIRYAGTACGCTNATGIVIPRSGGIRFGTYKLTTTTTFLANSTPNFVWQLVSATGRTKSQTFAFIDAATVQANMTTAPSTQTFTVSSNPALNAASGPTASVLSGTASICAGSSTNLSVAITGGTSPYTVVYNNGGATNDTVTSYVSGSNISVTPSATTTYTLVSVIDAGSNAGTGNSGSAVVTVNSGTNNAPTTASDCSSYTWSVNGTTYSASGTYQHIGTNVNGCPDTNTLNLTIGDPTIALASVGNTGSVVGSNVCGTQLQANGTSSYADGSCHPILSINTASALGSVTACANVMGSTPAMSNGQTFGKRWYSISPASAGTGSVTFYYTQADFTSYNAGNGTMDMPTVGGGAANINNMRIAQIENGVLSTATSYPAVLVWDATSGYWKATITGASIVTGGQYYFYGEPECNLSVNAATIAASAITATSANVTWDAVAGATGYVVRWRTGTNSWLSASTATNSRTLTGLSASTAYEVQVRTICNGGWGLNSTSGNFSTIAAPVLPACVTPTGLAASNITLTTADLTWNASNNATHYYIRWRPTSGGAYTAAYVTTASGLLTRTLPGLTPGTQYEAQIMLFCTGAMTATSAWSSAITFTTTAGVIPPACVAPTGLTAMSITPTSATATWNAAANATAYQVIWSVQGSGTWLSAYTSTLSRVLSPLANNTNYDMQVKAYCTGTAGSSSSFSPVVTFSTGAPAKQATLATTGVSVYPNPTSGELTIDLSVENELMTTIKVMDMSGRVVKQIQATTHAGQNSIKMNIDELTTGLYTIQVINNDRVINTSRVSKN